MTQKIEQEGQPFNPEKYTLEEILRPQHTGLLVVDIQNDFCHPDGKFSGWGRDITEMQAIVPRIQDMIDHAHAAGVQVIFTQGYEDVRFRKGPDLRRAVIIAEKDGDGSVNSESGTWGAEFYQLRPQEQDIVVTKHKWSAFDGKDAKGNPLDTILQRQGIQTLVITGVVSEVCVETTVRDAYSRDYFVVIPDGQVASNNQAQHEERMSFWRRGFVGEVANSDDIKKHWPAQDHLSISSTTLPDILG